MTVSTGHELFQYYQSIRIIVKVFNNPVQLLAQNKTVISNSTTLIFISYHFIVLFIQRLLVSVPIFPYPSFLCLYFLVSISQSFICLEIVLFTFIYKVSLICSRSKPDVLRDEHYISTDFCLQSSHCWSNIRFLFIS